MAEFNWSKMAQMQLDAEIALKNAEVEYERKKAALRVIKEEVIPNAMLEAGLQKVTLAEGGTITISQEVYASFPKIDETSEDYEANLKKRELATDWLIRHGHAGIVKTKVYMQYGAGESGAAAEFAATLIEMGYSPEVATDVHPMSLKAALKKSMKAGIPIPLDSFNARPAWVAKVKVDE